MRGRGALALLLALAGCAANPRGSAPEPLHVLVYNIHAGKDAAGQPSLPGVAEVVRRSGADLVLLQEVDRGTTRSGGEDQLATLERLTGLHGAFGRTLDFQGGEYGIAVLSRWPIEASAVQPLKVEPPQERAGGSYEPRGALRVRVAAPGGPLEVLNTHLDASRTDVYRLQEVGTVLQLADSLRATGHPVLVGGDFNSEPGSATHQRMAAAGWRDAWASCGTGSGLSFPVDRPVKRIDYLWLSPGPRCDSAAVLQSSASDHRPLRGLLTLP